MTYIILVLITILAAFVQGFSGFAFSLILMPLFSFFLPYQEIIIINMLLSLVLNLTMFIKIRKYVTFKQNLLMIIPACILTIIASALLDEMNEAFFQIMIGSLLVISSFLKIFRFHFEIRHYQRFFPLVGIIAGFLNGVSGISGPPIILFLQGVKLSKIEYKATLNAIFLSLNIVALSSYIFYDYYSLKILSISLTLTIFVILSTIIGFKASHKLSEDAFSKYLVVAILFMGIYMILQGAL